MLEYLNHLKEIHTDDESRIALEKIETALTEKKYGLVWEEHEEEVDKKLVHNIPVFREIEDKKIVWDNTNDFNFLLEGDNLHSLKLLKKTHMGKIDVIYIDPPYNTGNKDFIYDDNYIGSDDGYRHSKWLSFMNERLVIAKELLSDEGVIFISIDDNEQAQLKLLCDEVFGIDNFVSLMPRITKKAGKNHGNNISKNHDYILIYMGNLHDCFEGIEPDESKYPFKDEYYEERGSYKLNQTLDYNSLWYNPKMDFEVEIDNKVYVPGSSYEKHLERHNGIHNSKDWVWRWSEAKINFGLKNDFIVTKNKRIYTKTYLNVTIGKEDNNYFIERKDREQKYSSLHFIENIFSNDNAKKDLAKILENPNDFDFPKPISLIETIVKMIKYKNATVLDFFAGSGTTGQAVMQLNKEDGGNRKYILCTNNENNICEKITYQRMKNIQKDLPHNLKYYKTEFIPKLSEDEEILSSKLLDYIKEMVELENMCEIDGNSRRIILSDEDLKMALSEMKEGGVLYIPSFVLLTNEINDSIDERKLEAVTIPDYYFTEELREVNEL